MTQQMYLNNLEKGVKIINTYQIMINGQQNYKTLPHYMKVFGDFCLNYLKYKTIHLGMEVHHTDSILKLITLCKENEIALNQNIAAYGSVLEACQKAQYTDVAECITIMPIVNAILESIATELHLELNLS